MKMLKETCDYCEGQEKEVADDVNETYGLGIHTKEKMVKICAECMAKVFDKVLKSN